MKKFDAIRAWGGILTGHHPMLSTVHCTITRQMTGQPDYFERFLDHWSGRPEVRKVWFSLFTPQKGAEDEEVLRPAERALVLDDLGGCAADFRSSIYLTWCWQDCANLHSHPSSAFLLGRL
ncbi:MAG TPA: hypothetical protein VN345_11135 [Blastocatellia bacterium]|jgi:hypothetical protein|nr:hypothetical protein [Blastocatellia bacterium]